MELKLIKVAGKPISASAENTVNASKSLLARGLLEKSVSSDRSGYPSCHTLPIESFSCTLRRVARACPLAAAQPAMEEDSSVAAEVAREPRRLGRYILKRPLGKGGSGQVFLAWRENPTGEPLVCVLKFPLQRYAVDAEGKRWFIQEARLGMRLGCHPNIVHVFDVDYHNTMPFIAMDYVDGIDLSNLLRRLRRRGRGLKISSIYNIFASAAVGLHHAHSGGTIDGVSVAIVHRDITPSNILITRDGVVKLADFGIGVALEEGTTGNHWRGTARYMSPEHIACTPCPEMDIYSLGVVAWEMVENRPFREELEGPQHYSAIIDGKIPEMRCKDERLVDIIKLCLDPDPTRRPTANELSEALARCPGYNRDPTTLAGELRPIIGTRRSSGATQEELAATPELLATFAVIEGTGYVDSKDQTARRVRPVDIPPPNGGASGRDLDAPQIFRRRRPTDRGSTTKFLGPISVVCHPAAKPDVSSTATTKKRRAPTSVPGSGSGRVSKDPSMPARDFDSSSGIAGTGSDPVSRLGHAAGVVRRAMATPPLIIGLAALIMAALLTLLTAHGLGLLGYVPGVGGIVGVGGQSGSVSDPHGRAQ